MRKNRGAVKVLVVGMSVIVLAASALFTSIAGWAQTPPTGGPSPDGVWQAVMPNGAVWTVTLELIGSQLTGSISTGPEYPTDIYEGKVEGSAVVFKAKGGNGERVITFTGEVRPAEILFTRDVQVREGGSPGGTGIYGAGGVREFTAKRVVFVPAPPVVRQPPPIQDFQRWARQHVHAIASVEGETRGDADLRPLRDIVGRARVLAFGEPFHGGHEPLAMRNRLIRYAITQLGFTAVALESSLSASKHLYDHVLGITAETDAVLRQSFSYGFGEYPENLELLRWLRAFNAAQPPARQVRLYGIDLSGNNCACAYRSIEAVMTFLDRADPVLGRQVRQQYANVIPVFRSDRYVELTPAERVALTEKIQNLVTLIRRERVPLTAATSVDEFEWALRQAVQADQDDAFLRRLPSAFELKELGIAQEGFQQGERWDHRQELRELAMADNVRWVQERESSRGGKIFYFASDGHVATSASTVGSARRPFTQVRHRPAGLYLRSALDRDLIVIGTYYRRGTDPNQSNPQPPDMAGMDGLLSSLSIPRFIIDLRQLPKVGSLHEWFQMAHETRRNTIEAPLEAYDAILFLDDITPTPAPRRP